MVCIYGRYEKRRYKVMNKLIKKIAVLGIALTLITGAFTGCKGNNAATQTTVALPSYTSIKEASGELPVQGKIGDMKYRILSTEEYGNPVTKERGYFVDQLEQLDSPYFIVATSGVKTNDGNAIKIVDLGMQGSKLVIVIDEQIGSGEKYTGMNSPCVALEIDHDHMPAEFMVVTTTGEVLEHIHG